MPQGLSVQGMDGASGLMSNSKPKPSQSWTAWLNDEWFYCGIILSVTIDETELTDHAASLWGIEANYPDSKNAYLSQIANELLSDALDAAKLERERLCATICESSA